MNKIDEVVKIIQEIAPFENITKDTELVESEILDSLGLIKLVSSLEDTFNISLDIDKLVPENLKTAEIITKKLL